MPSPGEQTTVFPPALLPPEYPWAQAFWQQYAPMLMGSQIPTFGESGGVYGGPISPMWNQANLMAQQWATAPPMFLGGLQGNLGNLAGQTYLPGSGDFALEQFLSPQFINPGAAQGPADPMGFSIGTGMPMPGMQQSLFTPPGGGAHQGGSSGSGYPSPAPRVSELGALGPQAKRSTGEQSEALEKIGQVTTREGGGGPGDAPDPDMPVFDDPPITVTGDDPGYPGGDPGYPGLPPVPDITFPDGWTDFPDLPGGGGGDTGGDDDTIFGEDDLPSKDKDDKDKDGEDPTDQKTKWQKLLKWLEDNDFNVGGLTLAGLQELLSSGGSGGSGGRGGVETADDFDPDDPSTWSKRPPIGGMESDWWMYPDLGNLPPALPTGPPTVTAGQYQGGFTPWQAPEGGLGILGPTPDWMQGGG